MRRKREKTALFISIALICALGAITYGTGHGVNFVGPYHAIMINSEWPDRHNSRILVTDPQEDPEPETVNVVIIFTNTRRKPQLIPRFRLTLDSLLEHATVPVVIHILGDERSQQFAREIVSSQQHNTKYKLVPLDVKKIYNELQAIIQPMQDLFGSKSIGYFNHPLFFMSIVMHISLPANVQKVIMLDSDLKLKADIKHLYAHFQQFQEDNIIGIGRELQPVYRHTFKAYRKENPGTRVGSPPPDGLTGFNSGVLLLDLDRIRKSELYNSMLLGDSMSRLAKEFKFKGHLGDQDFFTLLGMKYENLFHVLPCTWNKQLCTLYKKIGYSDVFDQYYSCEGDVNIYHGNCNTTIPED